MLVDDKRFHHRKAEKDHESCGVSKTSVRRSSTWLTKSSQGEFIGRLGVYFRAESCFFLRPGRAGVLFTFCLTS